MLSISLSHSFLSPSIPDITTPTAFPCFLATQYVNLTNVLLDMAHFEVLSGWGERWVFKISLGKWNLVTLRRDFGKRMGEKET